jgi:Tfp pilus assembly protein PilX
MINHNQSSVGRFGHVQKGVVLITALIFLVVLTLLVLAAFRSTLFEELMARGTGMRLNALEAAEAVLRQAELDTFVPGNVYGNAITPIDNNFNRDGFKADCTGGLCMQAVGEETGTTPAWKAVDWTSDANTRISTMNIPGMSDLRYVVECMGACSSEEVNSKCSPVYLRVTARAVSAAGSKASVQTVYEFVPGHCPIDVS